MAIVRSVVPGSRNVKKHPTEVDSEFQAVLLADGKFLFQFSTFGSDTRASEPKVSQTVQFDENSAAELVRAIASVFPVAAKVD